jgi:hypothetical protein
VLGSGLLSSVGTCCLTTLVVCCMSCATSSSTVGGWTAASLSRLAHRVPVISFPLIKGSDDGISCDNLEFNRQHTQYFKTSTRLLYSRNLPLET